jgi:hypothetical protein
VYHAQLAIGFINAAQERHNRAINDTVALIFVLFFGTCLAIPTSWGLYRLAHGAIRRRRLRHNFPT